MLFRILVFLLYIFYLGYSRFEQKKVVWVYVSVEKNSVNKKNDIIFVLFHSVTYLNRVTKRAKGFVCVSVLNVVVHVAVTVIVVVVS